MFTEAIKNVAWHEVARLLSEHFGSRGRLIFEFEVSLIYIEFHTSRDAQWEHVQIKKKKENERKEETF